MKSVMLSIRPKDVNLIFRGLKTVDVRKTHPRECFDYPFKCYIYCTDKNTNDPHKLLEIHNHDDSKIYRGNGKIVGEFVCSYIRFLEHDDMDYALNGTCMTGIELSKYAGWGIYKDMNTYYWDIPTVYGWRISYVKIYNVPKDLSEFGLKRPPRSWCYVEAENK